MIEISIVVPVYNSEDNLSELCAQINDALQTVTYELLLVNDRSKDNSWAVIKQMSEKYAQVIGINLRRNGGQDNAIMAGLNNVNGNYIVIMDDDLQHSPYDIIKLLNSCKKTESDICFANFNVKKQAIWKNFGSWLNGKISEWLLNKPKGIYLSPFKIITKEVIDEIIKYSGPYPYIDGLLLSVTDNMVQINIKHHKRFQGKSNFNLTRSISVFLKHVTTFSITPLRVASLIGFICSLAGFLLIPYYIFDHFFNNNIVEGWTTLAILVLLIGGLILLSLGMTGEYLGRAYLNINKKPQFIIREIVKKNIF
ncbi:MAG: glycosyltransferase family 2 protein [Paludibacter sp.]